MLNISPYEAMAKLSFEEAERNLISEQFETLMNSFDALAKIDTESIEPLVTVLDIKNVLREDVTAKYISREELLSNAPEQYNGYFQVPKTLN